MRNGFTIIEIVIVLAILSITVGAGFLTYTQSFQRNTLKKDAEDLVNLLNTAKERSLRRDMTPNPSCITFRGYDVLFTTNGANHTYQLRFICGGAGADTYTPVLPIYTLQSNSFYNLTNGTTIPFYEPFGCNYSTAYPDPQPSCTITTPFTVRVRNLKNSCMTVTVQNPGVINLSDAAPCS